MPHPTCKDCIFAWNNDPLLEVHDYLACCAARPKVTVTVEGVIYETPEVHPDRPMCRSGIEREQP